MKHGSKSKFKNWIEKFSHWCNKNIKNLSQFYECFEKVSWKKTELVSGVREEGKTELLKFSWTEVMLNPWYGRCLTSNEIDTNILLDGRFQLMLRKNISYRIWFHDKDFFVLSWNPLSTSSIHVKMDLTHNPTRNAHINIGDRKRILINREKSPCDNYNLKYSFTSCIRDEIIHLAGCKLKWSKNRDAEVPFCKNIEDLMIHFNKQLEYDSMYQMNL